VSLQFAAEGRTWAKLAKYDNGAVQLLKSVHCLLLVVTQIWSSVYMHMWQENGINPSFMKLPLTTFVLTSIVMLYHVKH